MSGMETSGTRYLGPGWKAILRQALQLLAASLLLGGAIWSLRTDRLPLTADLEIYQLELAAPVVNIPEALELYDQGNHLFIDTRADLQTGQEAIPGTFVLRSATFADDLRALFDYLGPEDPLIIYGDGNLTLDSNIVLKLQERGYQNLLILKGGFPAWAGGGGETSTYRGDLDQ